jgi:hypothetical protein
VSSLAVLGDQPLVVVLPVGSFPRVLGRNSTSLALLPVLKARLSNLARWAFRSSPRLA